MKSDEVLIVGAGLTGATIARILTDAGMRIVVLESRPHVGGNVFDEKHSTGIWIHKHGPHYFRTSSPRIMSFVTRFGAWRDFEAEVVSDVGDGILLPWPPNQRTLGMIGAGSEPALVLDGPPANFEEACLSKMPRAVYELCVKPYNEKQWGMPAEKLDSDLVSRFSIRRDDERRLTPHAKWQAVPIDGYSGVVAGMLHDVEVRCGVDYLKEREKYRGAGLTVFTGPVDLFFDCIHGRLEYRTQERTTTFLPDRFGCVQPVVQINNPRHEGGEHIRTIEWKRLLNSQSQSKVKGTLLTQEIPRSAVHPGEYEYPVPDMKNRLLAASYAVLAKDQDKVVFAGRLGEYRYLDMDQAIGRAMTVAAGIMQKALRIAPEGFR